MKYKPTSHSISKDKKDEEKQKESSEKTEIISPQVFAKLKHPRLLARRVSPHFNLQTQIISAEFCANLSAAMIQLSKDGFNVESLQAEKEINKEKEEKENNNQQYKEETLEQFLLYDLSAHFGSHTLRRANSYPLGLCYNYFNNNKNNSQRRFLSNIKYHNGRRQLWSMRAAHQHWCKKCGIYLLRGVTKCLLPSLTQNNNSNNNNNNENNNNKKIVRRGTYVCRLCLNNAWKLWEKNNCLTTPPPSIINSHINFIEDEEGIEKEKVKLKEKQQQQQEMEKAKLSSENQNLYNNNNSNNCLDIISSIRVGRTRRRKRTRPGKENELNISKLKHPQLSLQTVKGNESAAMKIAVGAIPKGPLTRRKRERDTIVKSEVIENEKSGKKRIKVIEDNDIQQQQQQDKKEEFELKQKLPQMVGGKNMNNNNINCLNKSSSSSSSKKTEVQTSEEEKKSIEASTTLLIPKLPPRGRSSVKKKENNTSGTNKSSSFADTMSRLGL